MLRRTVCRLAADVEDMANRIVNGERRFISRGITLVESGNEVHRRQADELLQLVTQKRLDIMKKTGSKDRMPGFRVAVSGPPGAGKSCFIEALGTHLTKKMGQKVAVLTIDPSSTISGGSLLGDKTRMDGLSIDPNAYVRPSPTRGCLGGVAEATYDAIQICEGAGFDTCIVETVGVGQSEVDARNITDCFILLLPPANGDELQGIKKGIVEVADIVCITKADGNTEKLAHYTQAEYRKALQLIRPYGRCTDWKTPVLTCSAPTRAGIPEVWDAVAEFRQKEEPALIQRRKEHRVKKMWSFVRNDITRRIEADPDIREDALATTHSVATGVMVPRLGARHILDSWLATQGVKKL
eukprot:TRINITY_DN16441_c0_g1_i1.p1 TRINITY_DN16441_c0_g1~~TRINITY_DN16441_c0_g1_i1.p1  ORF type:complete len:354 (+),score=49.71 TRINITY_DN16441_c0_g1_i1:46-1107(+)